MKQLTMQNKIKFYGTMITHCFVFIYFLLLFMIFIVFMLQVNCQLNTIFSFFIKYATNKITILIEDFYNFIFLPSIIKIVLTGKIIKIKNIILDIECVL
jgi:hypothetical protein